MEGEDCRTGTRVRVPHTPPSQQDDSTLTFLSGTLVQLVGRCLGEQVPPPTRPACFQAVQWDRLQHKRSAWQHRPANSRGRQWEICARQSCNTTIPPAHTPIGEVNLALIFVSVVSESRKKDSRAAKLLRCHDEDGLTLLFVTIAIDTVVVVVSMTGEYDRQRVATAHRNDGVVRLRAVFATCSVSNSTTRLPFFEFICCILTSTNESVTWTLLIQYNTIG